MMGHWFSALDFLAVEPSPYIIGNRYATLFTKRSRMPWESLVPIGVSNVNSTRLDAFSAQYGDRWSPVAYESVSGTRSDPPGGTNTAVFRKFAHQQNSLLFSLYVFIKMPMRSIATDLGENFLYAHT